MPVVAAPESNLLAQFAQVRRQTMELVTPLSAEDMMVQQAPHASPTKWHLAHTTWFFETFLLMEQPGYEPFDPGFAFLFNSYYNALGERIPRARRSLLSRPGLDEVLRYRDHVDGRMEQILSDSELTREQRDKILIGLNHEQQHQELILTDIKQAFGDHPLNPAYREGKSPTTHAHDETTTWIGHPGGLVSIGHVGSRFAYDNESPRHQVFLRPFRLASALVTNGEYLEFIRDGGYGRPDLWLSDGWDACRSQDWRAPQYWQNRDGEWHLYTLDGVRPVAAREPVCHVSFYEADAFARWAGKRLPTEQEWEVFAGRFPVSGSFLEAGKFHPTSGLASEAGPRQLFGEAWQWTSSAYLGYPGYRPLEGALGEYNGKFMVNQFVLRGGSCATPRSHFRITYRNFFPPDARWQFTGIRLAEDV